MAKVKCVHCGRMVFEMAKECPYCKLPIANPDAPTKVSASPWTWKKTSSRKKVTNGMIIVIVVIAAAVLVAVYLFMTGRL
jgi:uncharacterized membrane protein YvbJ